MTGRKYRINAQTALSTDTHKEDTIVKQLIERGHHARGYNSRRQFILRIARDSVGT